MLAAYDAAFVALSYVVATLASFTALQLASRVFAAPNLTARRVWVYGGAVAMGFGVWSMHFLGMLALKMPIALSYEVGITVLSGVVAIGASAIALHIMGSSTLSVKRLVAGGFVLGAAICGMHYTGMAAIPVAPGIEYDWWLVAASAAVAVGASTVALWLVFFLTQRRKSSKRLPAHIAASLVMGLAICGMHYTGMAAANFAEGSVCASGTPLDKYALAYGVSLAAVVLLAAALGLSVLDAHLHRQRRMTLRLARENRALTHKAQHDHLTGLPNRAQLEERIVEELAHSRGSGRELAVLFLDLDGFKAVNDSAGHATGDYVLREIARRLTTAAGPQVFVSRVSGDEFVLVVRDHSVAQLQALCSALLSTIQAQIDIESEAYRVSASIGVALQLSPEDDVRTMLSRADNAMYQAKKGGKNSFRLADNPESTAMAKELERALCNREFELHFQPTVHAKTLQMKGVEALVRWNHPERGLVLPMEFIPAAEELGFIRELGDWILCEAFARLAQWQKEGQPYSLAVNMSAVQLEDERLPARVAELLTQHAVDPAQLILEVTETFAMKDVERCHRVLSALQDLGIIIAVDDFGTGYSSLSHLYRLPLGELKIDRSFVLALADDDSAAQICGAMIVLAHSLKLTVVAEGVETQAQQTALVKLGCDVLQGYRFGKPMRWSELNVHMSALSDELALAA